MTALLLPRSVAVKRPGDLRVFAWLHLVWIMRDGAAPSWMDYMEAVLYGLYPLHDGGGRWEPRVQGPVPVVWMMLWGFDDGAAYGGRPIVEGGVVLICDDEGVK